MVDSDALYKAIGKKIRDARERASKKLSQAKLAKQLDVSRASIVNIEAGRQRPPLDVIWKIAEALDTDPAMLIPTREELASMGNPVELNATMRNQIKLEAGGDSTLEKSLTNIVGKLLTKIEPKSKRGHL